MMKGIYIGLLFLSLNTSAQDALQAETDNGKPYLVHTVANGETLSGIGRNFKLTVAEIASFNKISADKGLKKDQEIRIPLKTDNLTQISCDGCAKVYYKVQAREGLYRIGLNFGNVKAETLKKLNNLPGEAVDIGQNLLVGYLSAPAGKMSNMAQKATPPQQNSSPTIIAGSTTSKPETKTPETVVKNDPPPVIEKAQPVETKPKEQPKQQPQTPPAQEPVKQAPTTTIPQNTGNDQGSGVFASEFQGKMNVSKSGTAAVFKSTSGWGDSKYYVLMNNADPGTIIKIQNSSTSKVIFAKVLGELPQIKQNENILLRISNAAAAALGGGEESLSISVNY